MTKMHFEAIAASLADAHHLFVSEDMHRLYAEALASRLATFNRNFNRGRFLIASGVR